MWLLLPTWHGTSFSLTSYVYSQSRLMLDIISKVLREVGIRICRIDGDVVGRYVLRSVKQQTHGSEPFFLDSMHPALVQ
jgi:hypothetical protein